MKKTTNLTEKREQQAYADEMAEHWGMIHCEHIGDRVFGVIRLAYTNAIITDVDQNFFKTRFCFENRDMAHSELMAWKARKFDGQFPKGWVACRQVAPQELIESFGADYAESFKRTLLNTCPLPQYPKTSEELEIRARLSLDKQEFKHLHAYLHYSGQI